MRNRMKYLTKDSRGNPTKTLPIVWVATIGVLILGYTNEWTGIELASALGPIAVLWLGREITEKVKK